MKKMKEIQEREINIQSKEKCIKERQEAFPDKEQKIKVLEVNLKERQAL